ncbi:MAG TPA: permease [Marinilabiliales bacterium]|nr:sulfite exporter TauE/SafE family protein [Salinivirgaceae bacterium]OFX41863.1 MAG: permease [Bacteroidetes bacterium GWA2_40_14]OFX61797.1 MAG: permease [Bacteroidetes bacterium GWC2_40_13]OFX76123.1 MAG: permease [Bacteroidetes bacterium GWD2_40_43]OFX94456.1 MAG: permease [Bacteroidetes bacterium GWE2_40_63]OFY18925.1 MAG: permease [Bacteroidetes bacterium GWF2_40_13]OFZ24828.1 MAG: permease [Bacteroidetes bacterium RIFOXYC2_FULL_40_12]HAM99422.1 permease [Marinilabiliales bacterium]
MDATTLLLLIAIGLVAGALGGLLGIGGGIIMIPAMVYVMGMGQHEAIGTSLAVMLPPIGLFAAYNYYKEGYINLKFALIMAAAFMVGSFFSSKLAVSIPASTIRKAFSIFLVIVAIKMFFSK